MADAPTPAPAPAPARKPRPATSPLTWAVLALVVVAALAGGYWAYAVVGPGRTVDTSGITPGMTTSEVTNVLGDPDEYVTSGDKTALRYGRTHVWTKGAPGRGGLVTEVTNGPK
ncbi:MAG: hypothetical protein K2X82_30395 [Gemmataceae bacterium]|nr:hypothetical protein [Gemmataceae bacterium]